MLTIPAEQLLAIARSHGLPLFVYDASTITRQIDKLRNAFLLPDLEIHYASKALNTIGVLQHIYREGCGIDTVSPGEIQIALRAGIPPEKITFTPSGVLTADYAFALSRHIHVHVDQFSTLEWLDAHFPGTSVTLRFNPGVQAGGHHKLQVGKAGSKFGFQHDQTQALRKWTEQHSLRVTGVHMHLGSDIGDSASFQQAFDFLLHTAALWSDTLQHVNLGGGFKVPYHPGDHEININAFGAAVVDQFESFQELLKKPITLILEPGKYLVSEAGHLLIEVSQVRESGKTDMIYVHSGFNHFIRPMNYDAYHEIVNLTNPTGELNRYDIVGYLCETDTFALERTLPEVRPGDILCLANAGAYGYSMASNYNSRPRPAEVLFENGQGKLIRRAETLEDLLRTDLGNG
jgi:diaminopimelate decarboxylase